MDAHSGRTRFLAVIALTVLLSMPALAQDNRVATREIVNFDNDLIPVLTKAGCNAGACHGAAIGRGDLKLSLFGGSPDADYRAIVRELEGRRVNLTRPEESLVLLKSTGALPHGGGRRLDPDGDGARLLLEWIVQGASQVDGLRVEQLEVTPSRHVANAIGQSVPVRATATFSDQSTRDVTSWTIFAAEDPSAVDVDPDRAVSTVLRRGRHIVTARYLGQVVPIELVVPLSDVPVDHDDEPRSSFIDELILELLAMLRVPTSPFADDPAFIRRVTLDLTGRLPATDAVAEFVADPSTGKREALVDRLLASDAFNDYWTFELAKLLRIRSAPRRRGPPEQRGALAYHQWLHQQISEGVGYDRLVRSLITATGDANQYGPANFYRTVQGPGPQAEFMSEVFMGARLRCANCHNHPLDRWTQDDYHGLAAIFATVDSRTIVKLNPAGEVIHPGTGAPATARIPGDRFLADGEADGRAALADWLTEESNPYFAKAIVNRLWSALMGRGLVEPLDDFRATNPATHPALLDALADDFVEHGYDLRQTLRRIALSTTYARSAATPDNATDDRFYSHALRRRLEPEVLADAISDVLGVADRYGDEPEGTRAVTLVDPATRSEALDILGRCAREASCENSTGPGGLTRTLHLFNGPLLNRRIGAPSGRLDTLISAGSSPAEIIGEFYLAAFSRRQTADEKKFWNEQLDADQSAASQRQILESFVWSLLVSQEFVTNH